MSQSIQDHKQYVRKTTTHLQQMLQNEVIFNDNSLDKITNELAKNAITLDNDFSSFDEKELEQQIESAVDKECIYRITYRFTGKSVEIFPILAAIFYISSYARFDILFDDLLFVKNTTNFDLKSPTFLLAKNTYESIRVVSHFDTAQIIVTGLIFPPDLKDVVCKLMKKSVEQRSQRSQRSHKQ